MKGFVIDLDQEARSNEDYRRVLYTAQHAQLVVMCIAPGDEIGEEVHDSVDQFIRLEEGDATIMLGDDEYHVGADFAVIIPAGVKHNIINTGEIDLKLYSLYSPPEHKDKTVHHTKQDEKGAPFDGVISEQVRR